MFEVKRSEGLKVKIYGEEFLLKKPSVKMIEDYAIDIEVASKAEQFARAKTLVMKMGLPSKFFDESDEALEFDHLQGLIQHLTESMSKSSKKN